ncbi:MAG TPA: GGDEF domain-containing protein [Verrucomicrobiae bacterium]|jgi:diguanylate cyclase (GGDEF)-like protein|nr:GGDEF domain-containing protein [Verrucomicrobiae bacterium]
MTSEQRERRHALACLATFCVALAAVAAMVAYGRPHFDARSATLLICATLALAFVASNGVPLRGLRLRRGSFSAEALFLDSPIEVPLFGYMGATAAALAALVGFGIAAALRRRDGGIELARQGGIRVLAILAISPLHDRIFALATAPTAADAIVFFGIVIAVTLLVIFTASLFVALRSGLGIGDVSLRLACDRRVWWGTSMTVVWAYVTTMMWPHASTGLTVALWLPLVLTAYGWRRIDDQVLEIRRLRLVRDAMQAMVASRDPVPQINSILGALHGPLFDETLTILGAAAPHTDHWPTIATLGQAPDQDALDLQRRALARMRFASRPTVTLHGERGVVHVIAILDRDDSEPLGALIVHRHHEAPASDARQYVKAAAEIAPLMRDMRSISQTRTAATTDTLTGLPNRGTILHELQSMLDSADVGSAGAVLLLDIDRFKSVNDELGHAAGDDCLRRIAGVIVTSIREGDYAGRIGGEEFLVVMPRASREVALHVGERLRASIESSGSKYSNGSPVTTSIGVATIEIGETADTALERADRALYQAKRLGRNRVVDVSA